MNLKPELTSLDKSWVLKGNYIYDTPSVTILWKVETKRKKEQREK